MQKATLLSVHKQRWDIAGISASLLCILHCIAVPFFIAVVPALAATEKQTHGVLALTILLLGMLAFVSGYRRHRNKSIPATGVAGVFMLFVALLLPETQSAETMETLLVVVGGMTLISAHLRNAYWCRFCSVCAHECCVLEEASETDRLAHE